jgi:hypothetical protein
MPEPRDIAVIQLQMGMVGKKEIASVPIPVRVEMGNRVL